jgi:putative GTP pyrophosphokinase
MLLEQNKEILQTKIINEFEHKKISYDNFEECLRNLITRIVESSDITPHAISSRRKGRESLINKIKQPGKVYSELKDITDIVGLRITTYFEEQVDDIKELIEREFDVDEENSVDKRRLHDPDRFGYMSLHYVISIKPQRLDLIEYSAFSGMKAEIQIRSILQHTWAEIEHDLGYKSKYSIPNELKRRFSQLSSLLELADREFLQIKHSIEDYDKKVIELLDRDPSEIDVDKNSIVIISRHDPVILKLDNIVCKVTGANLTNNNYYSENVANMLLWLNITRVSELFMHIDLHTEIISKFADNWISQKEYKEFNHGVSLMYLCYLILAEQGDEDKINKFASKFSLGKHVDDFGKHLIGIYAKTIDTKKTTKEIK